MLYLYCPHCGEHRDEEEFSYAGEAYIPRPNDPDSLTDEAWGDYVFMRRNPKGWFWEQWSHTAGCRKVMAVKRHTVTNQVAASYTLAEGKAHFVQDLQAEMAAQPVKEGV